MTNQQISLSTYNRLSPVLLASIATTVSLSLLLAATVCIYTCPAKEAVLPYYADKIEKIPLFTNTKHFAAILIMLMLLLSISVLSLINNLLVPRSGQVYQLCMQEARNLEAVPFEQKSEFTEKYCRYIANATTSEECNIFEPGAVITDKNCALQCSSHICEFLRENHPFYELDKRKMEYVETLLQRAQRAFLLGNKSILGEIREMASQHLADRGASVAALAEKFPDAAKREEVARILDELLATVDATFFQHYDSFVGMTIQDYIGMVQRINWIYNIIYTSSPL